MNFTRDVVDTQPRERRALVAIDRQGRRREISFGEVSDRAARLAGHLLGIGVGRGDVVMTLLGNRPEWVYTLLACWRIGAVAQPCVEQLTAADLEKRIDALAPRALVVDQRNLERAHASGFDGAIVALPDERVFAHPPAPAVELAATDPALIVFTSGTQGEPKPIRHGQRYLFGQRVQAEHWYAPRAGELAWCTAAAGWSKSARNTFIAPWLRGACALLHDARFDPEERLALIERERVDVLCMSPTEYRAIAKRVGLHPLPVRHAVAAGEPLDAPAIEAWREGAGVEVRDGYGQTETGALTGVPLDEPLRPGSMGKPLPGFRLWVDDNGELVCDPTSIPTFFLDGPEGVWRTGDRVRQDADGWLWFEGRVDDVIISSGYRIGPFEVESALNSHPAVAEAAAVPAPDEIRGQVVRAVVVLRPGYEPSAALARELQEHVRQRTAPYKYPRIVDFVDSLPKTPSGKIKRSEVRRLVSGGAR